MSDLLKSLILYVAFAGSLLAVMILMSGCKTQTVIVPEIREVTTHDTIVRVDSVYRAHYIREKGDTVFVTDTVLKYAFKDKVQIVMKTDSVPYAVEVVKEVHKRNGYDRFVSWGFWVLVALLFARVAWWAFKTFYLRR